MALQVVSHAVSVYKETGVKDGTTQVEEHILKRGELVPDWVSPHQLFVLSQTGMAKQVGDFPDPNLRAPEDMPRPVVLPEHNPSTVVGSGVSGPVEVTRRVEAGTTTSTAGASRRYGDLPKDSDNKTDWEDAAVELGMSRAEAESMRKADLVREVRTRQTAKQEQKSSDTTLNATGGAAGSSATGTAASK